MTDQIFPAPDRTGVTVCNHEKVIRNGGDGVIVMISQRGISSVGRAIGSQSIGQGFESPILHRNPPQSSLRGIFRISMSLVRPVDCHLAGGHLSGSECSPRLVAVSPVVIFLAVTGAPLPLSRAKNRPRLPRHSSYVCNPNNNE